MAKVLGDFLDRNYLTLCGFQPKVLLRVKSEITGKEVCEVLRGVKDGGVAEAVLADFTIFNTEIPHLLTDHPKQTEKRGGVINCPISNPFELTVCVTSFNVKVANGHTKRAV